MFSRIRVMLMLVGLALVALAGLTNVSQQVGNAVRISASAVWGS